MLATSELDKLVTDALHDADTPLPRLAVAVASRDAVLWSTADGPQTYPGDGRPPEGKTTLQTPFALFSQTKLITCLCGLQLLEQGRIHLEDRVDKYVPELQHLKILSGYSQSGEELYEDVSTPPVIKDLFRHTGGFTYTPMSPEHERFRLEHGLEKQVEGLQGDRNAITSIPLLFQPGTRVSYGTGIDWLGYVVEAVSGMDLEEYTQKFIMHPLGVDDFAYRRSDDYIAKQANLVTPARKDGRVTFEPATTVLPVAPIACGGGGSSNCSAGSFIKLLQALLNDGVSASTGEQILRKETVDLLFTPLIDEAEPILKEQVDRWLRYDQDPFHRSSSDPAEHEAVPKRRRAFAMGSGLNLEDLPGGRRAGTLFGAGFGDTYWWIDRKANICCTFMANTAPSKAPGVYDFWEKLERAIYASV